MLADINFATGLRAQLQSANLGYLAGAASGLVIAGAALELGINEALVRAAISDLGISCARHSLTEEEYKKIIEWIRTRGISTTLDEHVMKEKHGWTEKCREDCILQVACNLQIHSAWFVEEKIPIIRGTGNCRHGCLIEVRMKIPINQKMWSIGTAFHKGPCLAK